MSKLKFVLVVVLALSLSTIFMGLSDSHARKFPWKPIKVIVPLGAGGSHDLNTRAVAAVAYDYLGQPMIVQLMPGAGGKIAMHALKKAKNDGHTLLKVLLKVQFRELFKNMAIKLTKSSQKRFRFYRLWV